MQDFKVQLIGPPVPVRCASAGIVFICSARYRTLAVIGHTIISGLSIRRTSQRSTGPNCPTVKELGLSATGTTWLVMRCFLAMVYHTAVIIEAG